MAIESKKSDWRKWWRLGLFGLVALPFLPEVIILMTAAAARIRGCKIEKACAAVPWAGETVGLATDVGMSIGVALAVGFVVVWLAVCYVAITLGWESLSRRFVLALGATLVFASLPYLSPGFVLYPFVNTDCLPSTGGSGACKIYGDQQVGVVVHETASLPGFMIIAAPLTILAFTLYVIVLRVRLCTRGASAKTG